MKNIKIDEKLIAKCGYYCGACPTYLNGNCSGCYEEHSEGDCFTRDCVINKNICVCGQCADFPCDTILTKPHSTVLDSQWLQWKKNSGSNC